MARGLKERSEYDATTRVSVAWLTAVLGRLERLPSLAELLNPVDPNSPEELIRRAVEHEQLVAELDEPRLRLVSSDGGPEVPSCGPR